MVPDTPERVLEMQDTPPCQSLQTRLRGRRESVSLFLSKNKNAPPVLEH